MRHLARTSALLAVLAHVPTVMAQDDKSIPTGRWVKQGTYAMSGFAVNPEREHTYRGAGKERSRLLSYLPAMTIIFPDFIGLFKGEPVPEGYVPGITQTGTPVQVLERELSSAKFGTSDTHDVVIHVAHDACPEAYCELTTEGRPVGSGQSYNIVEESETLVHLYNPTSEANFYYRTEQFNQSEQRGTLTRMKERIIPRWDIREGYAKELSVGCGGQHPAGTTFTADSEAYESGPDTWVLNAPQWTVKAAELFVGSSVEKTGATYTAEIIETIHDVTKTAEDDDNYKSAIDFTVFAYRDRNSKDKNTTFQFAVLISIVACTSQVFGGNFIPGYVREAHLLFEGKPYKLPQQINEEGKKRLSTQIDRSFMYSVNTPRQYEQLFSLLAEGLSVQYSDVRSNLVAVILARLNATCVSQRRVNCAQIVDNEAIPAELTKQ